MNIITKIVLVNKTLNAVKEIKQVLNNANSSDLYKEIKTELENIAGSLERLAKFVPTAKEIINIILGALK